MVFCNKNKKDGIAVYDVVTILILVDGFLQSVCMTDIGTYYNGHNPYFSRWFSAIRKNKNDSIAIYDGHNPYFSRWFSAI